MVSENRFLISHLALGHQTKKKKKNALFSRRKDLPCRVGWSGIFNYFFFYFWSKNDLKNTKILVKNVAFFAEKFWENILTYFQNFLLKFLYFWSKSSCFLSRLN